MSTDAPTDSLTTAIRLTDVAAVKVACSRATRGLFGTEIPALFR